MVNSKFQKLYPEVYEKRTTFLEQKKRKPLQNLNSNVNL